MPDDYKYTATDPKTGNKVGWDGKAWVPIKPPSKVMEGVKTFGREAALGGFSGLGIQEGATAGEVLKNTAAGLVAKPSTSDIIGSSILGPAYNVGKGLAGSTAELVEGLGANQKKPWEFGAMDPAKMGHGVGSLLSQLLLLKGGREAAEKPLAAGELARGSKGVLREAWGVGTRDVEMEAKKAAAKESKKVDASTKKIDSARDKYADAVQEHLQKRIEASAKESAAKTKQEALGSKHGPVYKRMNEMADDVQKHVEEVEQKVNETESKKWSDFSAKMENTKVGTQGVSDTIADVRKNILTGESVPVFNQIMMEILKDEGGAEEFIDRAGGIVPKSSDIPLDLARRLYTKIGRKLGGSEMPRDVARALGKVGDELDSTIAEGVTKKGGAEALSEYRNLQKSWRQYRETFSDKDSPLRKIVEAKDPKTKLNPIVGDTGARAIDYLGRYKNMGADPAKVGKIRALDKSLRELPSTGGKAPAKLERPELPAKAEAKVPSAEELRRQMLERRGTSYSGPPRRFEMFIPPLYAFRMLLKQISQNPKFIDWMARESGKSSAIPTMPPEAEDASHRLIEHLGHAGGEGEERTTPVP